MIEIEKRVFLNKKQFSSLLKLFKSKGKFIKEFKRFSLISVDHSDFTPNQDSVIDIRVRTTKDGGKFTIKYGDWHTSSSREEYEIDFKREDTPNLVNMIRVLGYNYFMTTYVHRYVFEFQKFVITLDEYYSSENNLMEIEVVANDTQNLKEVEKEMDEFLKEYKLKPLDSKAMVAYIQSINDVIPMRVDITKTTVEEWYKKWKDYVFCLK